MKNEIKHLLQAHFNTQVAVAQMDQLSEPNRRNLLLRIHLKCASQQSPNTMILKQSLPQQSGEDADAFARFARDWASLELMSQIPHQAHNVPKFFVGSKAQRFILIEDLGEKHISLVDSLTLPDRDRAIAALTRFMQALGSFHAATFEKTSDYIHLLQNIHPKTKTWEDDLQSSIDNLLPKLKSVCEWLDLNIKPEWIEAATEAIRSIFVPGPFTVLTHGDICPDNVFDHEGFRELQLIDFEWAAPRNALADATYLRMTMPTCWCAKAIPDSVIEGLEKIYREELQITIPAAKNNSEYVKAYTHACAYWLLRTLALFDDVSVEDQIWSSGPVPEKSLWKANQNFVRPRILSRLATFIDVSSKNQTLTQLSEMAKKMKSILENRWPNAKPLEFYPAFSSSR